MRKLGKNKADQKRSNWGLVLKLLATGKCNSRIDLARATGLTKPAISQIVGEFIHLDLVEESDKEIRAELGRNPTGLIISPKAPKVIGVLIDRAFCAVVLADLNLHVIRREEIRKEIFTEAELMENVFQLLDLMFTEEQNAAVIGIASIGPVNVSEGMIVNPYHFHDIHDVKIRKKIEERYKLPVFFDHDNQSAVLAESLYGNGRNYQDMLLVSISRGVGCGIIVQGHRIHSSYGYAPEIGHISLDHNGEVCICGNRGCLELYVNSEHVRSRLMAATGKDMSYDDFIAVSEDPDVDKVMLECVDNLTSALISVMNILNTQLILLGMDCCLWPDRYIERIEEEINRVKFGNKNIRIPVKKTYFMRDSQLLGAACNGINAIFNGDIPGFFD